jgi:hypothetical protein
VRYRDREVVGFGEERRAQIDKSLREVLTGLETFARSLAPREEIILRVGLESSHAEEALGSGDFERGEIHVTNMLNLIDLLGKTGVH